MSFKDIPIKTVDWMKPNDFMLVSNGQDALVKLDGTDKTITKQIKQPSMVIYHKGRIFDPEQIKDLSPE